MGTMFGWRGMNSGVDPEFLDDSQAFQCMNVVSRGGKLRTRPSFNSLFNAPNGFPQGITLFTPNNGIPNLVFACGGYIYYSPFPFVEYDKLPNVQFSPQSRFVVFQDTLQTTDYDADGRFFFLNRPRKILVMQDGNTPAAFWDGSESRHLNPQKSNQEFTLPLRDETPLGLWMAWVADRLIVFRGNLGYASDIGNPLKFTETQYLSEGRAFTFPDDVTGAVQPYSGSPLVVFTNNTRTELRVDIRDRTKWVDTQDFQQTDYNLGCVSGRSIVRSYGETWWFTQYGITNLNYALRVNNDSSFRYLDNEMAVSKARLSPTLEGICATSFENYLLMSVPATDIYNKHTWVLDQSNTPAGNAAWDGYWTGIRPVQWATDVIEGKPRAFCLSLDEDGVGRVWEAFGDERSDNGCPITCLVETKRYNDQNKEDKQFSHARLHLDEIVGTVDLATDFAGDRGPYNRILTKRFESTRGSVKDGFMNQFQDFVSQSRVINTQRTDRLRGACNDCGVEGEQPHNISSAFSISLTWSGSMAVRGVQLFYDTKTTDYEPDCGDDESGDRIVTAGGCETMSRQSIPDPGNYFTSTKEVTVECDTVINPEEATASATVTSWISQKDADDSARCRARQKAIALLTCDIGEEKPWILEFGVWDDNGVWKDTENWIDNI